VLNEQAAWRHGGVRHHDIRHDVEILLNPDCTARMADEFVVKFVIMTSVMMAAYVIGRRPGFNHE
jgi:hypothetical protein